MKKLITILLILISLNGYSQTKIGTYHNSYLNENYNIELDTKDTTKFDIYFYAHSFDNLINEGGFVIKQWGLEEFIKHIQDAKQKYIDWVKVAKENNVTDLNKDMEIYTFASGFFKTGNHWHFQNEIDLKHIFRVRKDKNIILYSLFIGTGQLQASDNEFTNTDGFAIIFYSVKEIDDFLNKISMDKINFYLKESMKKDLFK